MLIWRVQVALICSCRKSEHINWALSQRSVWWVKMTHFLAKHCELPEKNRLPKMLFWAKSCILCQKWTFVVSLTIYIEVEGHVIAQNDAIDRTEKTIPPKKLAHKNNIFVWKWLFLAENIEFWPKMAIFLLQIFLKKIRLYALGHFQSFLFKKIFLGHSSISVTSSCST